MKRRVPSLLMLTLAIATTLAGTAPAHADVATVRTSRRVSLRGLDLASPRGAAAAYRRLRHAAQDVCSDGGRPTMYFVDCSSQALQQAIDDLNRPLLTSLREARSHP